jgi:hypothetical protein
LRIAIGTFNPNNLFSRIDFEADVSTAATSTVETPLSRHDFARAAICATIVADVRLDGSRIEFGTLS